MIKGRLFNWLPYFVSAAKRKVCSRLNKATIATQPYIRHNTNFTNFRWGSIGSHDTWIALRVLSPQPLPKEYRFFDQIDGIGGDYAASFGGSVALADYCPFVQVKRLLLLLLFNSITPYPIYRYGFVRNPPLQTKRVFIYHFNVAVAKDNKGEQLAQESQVIERAFELLQRKEQENKTKNSFNFFLSGVHLAELWKEQWLLLRCESAWTREELCPGALWPKCGLFQHGPLERVNLRTSAAMAELGLCLLSGKH